MTTMIGYARVSTEDQVMDMQIDALIKAGVNEDKIYKEKASGAKDDRTELAHALKALNKGDTFVVYKLDRLARSTKKLIEVYELLEKKGVELVSICDRMDTKTATGRAMFKMIGVIAELEREMIVDRTKAGLASARARGRVGGRPKADYKHVDVALALYDSQKYTVADIERETGIKKATLYRALKARDSK